MWRFCQYDQPYEGNHDTFSCGTADVFRGLAPSQIRFKHPPGMGGRLCDETSWISMPMALSGPDFIWLMLSARDSSMILLDSSDVSSLSLVIVRIASHCVGGCTRIQAGYPRDGRQLLFSKCLWTLSRRTTGRVPFYQPNSLVQGAPNRPQNVEVEDADCDLAECGAVLRECGRCVNACVCIT